MDRLPCTWRNPGNAGNVMFARDGAVVSIDNMMSCIDPRAHAAGFDAYREAVQGLLRGLARDPFTAHFRVDRVRTMLLNGTEATWPGLGLDYGTEGTLHVQLGFLHGMRKIAAFPADTLAREWRGITGLVEPHLDAGGRGWRAGIERVNLAFLGHVAQWFRDALEQLGRPPPSSADVEKRRADLVSDAARAGRARDRRLTAAVSAHTVGEAAKAGGGGKGHAKAAADRAGMAGKLDRFMKKREGAKKKGIAAWLRRKASNVTSLEDLPRLVEMKNGAVAVIVRKDIQDTAAA